MVLTVVLLSLLLGGVYSLSNLSRATKWLSHTDEVRVAIGDIRSSMLDAESAMRGYAMSGEAALLQPYRHAVSDWRDQIAHVQRLTTDNPTQQQRLRRLGQAVGQRMALLGKLREAYDAGSRGRSVLPIMQEGNQAMRAVREIIDAMEREEVRLDGVRQAEANRRWQLTVVIFVASVLAVLVVAALVWTQRRHADIRRQAIDGERHLLQVVLSGIEDGITMQDRQGGLIFANAPAARLIGFASPAELLAAPVPTIMERFEIFDAGGLPFPPEQLPARAVLQGESKEAEVVLRHRLRGSGEDRWSSVRAYPVHDESGQVVQAINVFRDVSVERQNAERTGFLLRAADELNASLDYERTLSAVARLAVPVLADWCVVDLEENGVPKRVATAHVDEDKIVAVQELERRYPSDPNARTGVAEILRSGEAQFLPHIPRELLQNAAVDEEHLRLIDELDLRSYVGVPLKVAGKTIGAITLAMAESRRIYTAGDLEFAQSLADRAALAIENARLFREVERARAAISVELVKEEARRKQAEGTSRFAEMFVGILGHDLRNPLNAVTMTAKLLQRKAARDDAAVARILSSAERMSNMVTQLLDLTRSRLAGGITVDPRPADLGAVISDVVDELRRAFPGRDIDWQKGQDQECVIDQDRVAQVASNLISNALLHGDPAKPTTVTLRSNGGSWSLVVHNFGTPIPERLSSVIFDPFRRTTARDEKSAGLGLGLFISRQIVIAHGGTIEVDSTAAAGTTFTVNLPASPRAAKLVASADGHLIA
ncbi:MAG: CHASE3 domain-containing protein [Bacteroidota bacterium]